MSFKVWGSRLGVLDLGFRVQCVRERERGFRVGYSRVWVSRYWGFAFRVLGWFRALGFFRASYRG